MSREPLPPVVEAIARDYPEIWDAYGRLGEAAEKAGPLDEKTMRLVKLALAVGAGRQGAVHSHARRGKKVGLTADAMRQVALLAITTVGWSSSVAALCWINEVIDPPAKP